VRPTDGVYRVAVNSFDHPLGEAHYDEYAPRDVEPAMDAGRVQRRDPAPCGVSRKVSERTRS